MVFRAVFSVLLAVTSASLSAEPAPMSVVGETRPDLAHVDQEALRGFQQERITHITFHHEGYAGDDADLFARASKARRKQSTGQRVRNINAYHAGPAGLGMIAYHYAIGADGVIAKGRPVRLKPATRSTIIGGARLADFEGHFAVVALGDFNHEHLTDQARFSLIRVMSEAQRAYRVPTKNILPHKHHAQTSCPGRHLLDEADALAQMTLVFSLQTELDRRGCGPISADGKYGPASRDAYQKLLGRNSGALRKAATEEDTLFALLDDPNLRCD